MKNLIVICILLVGSIAYSQDKQPTFVAEADLVKATYYFDDGEIKTQGYFKNKKLTGEWTRFDSRGNKTQLAYYNNGKKVGKWYVWTKESLKEISYKNNALVTVNIRKQDAKLAINK